MQKLSLVIFAILILGCGTEKPVVEEPEPVIEEPPPVTQASAPGVASGEHFRIDYPPIWIEQADINDGDFNVNPKRFNLNGIRLVFNGHPFLVRVDLRVDGGASLGWSPRGVVEHADIFRHIEIEPVAGRPLLEFDTAYIITFYAQSFACQSTIDEIRFRTMPKP